MLILFRLDNTEAPVRIADIPQAPAETTGNVTPEWKNLTGWPRPGTSKLVIWLSGLKKRVTGVLTPTALLPVLRKP